VNQLVKDVTHSFSLPKLLKAVPLLAGALVQPFGLVKQFTLDKVGEHVVKWCLTQDLPFLLTDNKQLVNAHMDMDHYNKTIYGWYLSQLIHYTVALCMKHPTSKIFIVKYDYSNAYQPVNHSAKAAAQSIALYDGVAYVALYLHLEEPQTPHLVPLCGNGNRLSKQDHLLCQMGSQNSLQPNPNHNPNIYREVAKEEPFAQGLPMAVEVPVLPGLKTSQFINDLIQVFLDTPKNQEQGAHFVPLAVHTTSQTHPVNNKQILRRSQLGTAKTPGQRKTSRTPDCTWMGNGHPEPP
jgi:hypothetical protein